MKTQARKLNWFQLLSLDAIAFLVLIALALYKIIRVVLKILGKASKKILMSSHAPKAKRE